MDDLSILKQFRRRGDRRLRWLPLTLIRQAIPVEMAVTVPVWLLVRPLDPHAEWTSLALQTLALAASAAALVYIRRIAARSLEIGWRMILFAQLLALLDAATGGASAPLASKHVLGLLWVVGGLGVFLGLRLDWSRRADDIERLKFAVAERHSAHRRFVDFVDTVDGIVWEATVAPFQFQFVSRRAGLLLGFEPEIWIQQANLWSDRIHPDDRDEVLRKISEAGRTMQGYRLEYRMIAADGRTLWVRDLVNVVKDEAGQPKLRGVTVDVTETKQLEQRLRHGANHDALTGLPNRSAFIEGLERAFRNSRQGSQFAVFFLDLDHFKAINDSVGHIAGDYVLEETAARILRAVRSRDMVARLGGDEFAVLAERLASSAEAAELAERLRRELNRPIEAGGKTFPLSASVGVKLVRPDGGSPMDILRDADVAMYAAKTEARGSQKLFDQTMPERHPRNVRGERRIQAGQ